MKRDSVCCVGPAPSVRSILFVLMLLPGAILPVGNRLLAAQPSRVTAIHNSASTGLENGLYQREIGKAAGECRFLGKYGLGVTNGANGPDFTVTLGNPMAGSGTRLCGDYQILPPPRGTVVIFK